MIKSGPPKDKAGLKIVNPDASWEVDILDQPLENMSPGFFDNHNETVEKRIFGSRFAFLINLRI